MSKTTSPIEDYVKSLPEEGVPGFTVWLSSLTPYTEQDLVYWYKDCLEGIERFDLLFKHTPVGLGSERSMYVSSRGRSLEEAIGNYMETYDKTKWCMVRYIQRVIRKGLESGAAIRADN